jgi:hypothetical protein
MTYFDITIRTAGINIDSDDLTTLINIIGDENIDILGCDDYELPDFIMKSDVDDIIQYIENCENLGTGYALYCENHHTYLDANIYETDFMGEHSSYDEIVQYYLDSFELPSPILNSIDSEKLASELGYTILESGNMYYVFSE